VVDRRILVPREQGSEQPEALAPRERHPSVSVWGKTPVTVAVAASTAVSMGASQGARAVNQVVVVVRLAGLDRVPGPSSLEAQLEEVAV
jgi:xanthine dehydrogenase iron-sulfur cluster and FAD-binding subunit A